MTTLTYASTNDRYARLVCRCQFSSVQLHGSARAFRIGYTVQAKTADNLEAFGQAKPLFNVMLPACHLSNNADSVQSVCCISFKVSVSQP